MTLHTGRRGLVLVGPTYQSQRLALVTSWVLNWSRDPLDVSTGRDELYIPGLINVSGSLSMPLAGTLRSFRCSDGAPPLLVLWSSSGTWTGPAFLDGEASRRRTIAAWFKAVGSWQINGRGRIWRAPLVR